LRHTFTRTPPRITVTVSIANEFHNHDDFGQWKDMTGS
jgi:hypothetical protein